MRGRYASVQVGAALLVLVAVIGLASSWMLVSRLNAESANLETVRRQRNAEVLNRAKQALIGYVAAQAAKTFEDDPGRLPCPEAAAFFGDAEYEGQSSPYCTAGGIPAVGRFPWRTVGTEKLVDASGEPLWYVVASGWAKPSSTAHTVINSNCTADPTLACYGGQLTVDGAPRAAVALIIAPGPAIAVAADSAAGCAAHNQARSTAGPLDRRDYLECENSHVPADVRFATRGPKASFNDQVIAITAEELLPAIEAAVADRFERVVAPALRHWTFTTLAANKPKGHTSLTVRSTRGISAGDTIGLVLNDGGLGWATVSAVVSETTLALAPNSLGAATAGYDVLLKPRPGYPFAASFPVSSGASYRGVAGITQGLLPTGYATSGTLCTPLPCTPSACAPLGGRCDPMFVVWRDNPVITRVSGGALDSSSHCSAGGVPSVLTCTINVSGASTLEFKIEAVAENVGMSLRRVNPTVAIGGVDTTYHSPYGYTLSSPTLNADGSATVSITARVSGAAASSSGLYSYVVTVPIAVFSDHPFVDPTNALHAWFFRNRWHEVSYYAVAAGHAPSGAGSCTTNVDCLLVARYFDSNRQPAGGRLRSVLIVGGRALGPPAGCGGAGQTRPAAAACDLLEGANADGASPFEVRSPGLVFNRTFNDRFAVIDSN